jgi:hypothetical protein
MTPKQRDTLARLLVIGGGLVALVFLARDWRAQRGAALSCGVKFDALADHNGYIQLNVLSPHPVEQTLQAELFLYYAGHESPPENLRLTREANGGYAPSILDTSLVPWSKGRATPKPVSFDIPTPGVSLKNFPFDSRSFDISLHFDPSRRPKVVFVRNMTTDFVPVCSSLTSKWDGIDKLSIKIEWLRNPFVRTTTVIIAMAALAFALLLGRIKETEPLATATASYFFSIWSVRGIVAPSGLAYPTALDLWLMTVSIIVLFLVAWRLVSRPQDRVR